MFSRVSGVFRMPATHATASNTRNRDPKGPIGFGLQSGTKEIFGDGVKLSARKRYTVMSTASTVAQSCDWVCQSARRKRNKDTRFASSFTINLAHVPTLKIIDEKTK